MCQKIKSATAINWRKYKKTLEYVKNKMGCNTDKEVLSALKNILGECNGEIFYQEFKSNSEAHKETIRKKSKKKIANANEQLNSVPEHNTANVESEVKTEVEIVSDYSAKYAEYSEMITSILEESEKIEFAYADSLTKLKEANANTQKLKNEVEELYSKLLVVNDAFKKAIEEEETIQVQAEKYLKEKETLSTMLTEVKEEKNKLMQYVVINPITGYEYAKVISKEFIKEKTLNEKILEVLSSFDNSIKITIEELKLFCRAALVIESIQSEQIVFIANAETCELATMLQKSYPTLLVERVG